MSEKEVASLNSQIGDAKKIKELMVQSGWKLIEQWLTEFWQEGFDEVRNSSSTDTSKLLSGKTKMEVVEKLQHKIGITIGFGEQAMETFNRKYR